MSLESSGLPETVCAPEMTQLLEPGSQDSHELAGGRREREVAAKMPGFFPELPAIVRDSPNRGGTAALGRAKWRFLIDVAPS